jgi:hypothetical protein
MILNRRDIDKDPEDLAATLQFYREWFRVSSPRLKYFEIALNPDLHKVKRRGQVYYGGGKPLFALHRKVRRSRSIRLSHIPSGLGFPPEFDNYAQGYLFLQCLITFIPLDWFNLTVANHEARCSTAALYYKKASTTYQELLWEQRNATR